MELNHIRTFDLRTQFRYHFTVYRNHTCCDKFISLTTGANTCVSQELIQTNRFIRINELFLVLDLFLYAILSVRIIIAGTRTRTISSL